MAQAILLGLDEGYYNVNNCTSHGQGALKVQIDRSATRDMGVMIHPNPAENFVEIRLLNQEDSEQWEVRLYSISGGLTKVLNVKSDFSGLMSLEDVLPGTYVMEVRDDERQAIRK